MKQELRGSCHNNTVPNENHRPHLTSIWNKLSERSKDTIRQVRRVNK